MQTNPRWSSLHFAINLLLIIRVLPTAGIMVFPPKHVQPNPLHAGVTNSCYHLSRIKSHWKIETAVLIALLSRNPLPAYFPLRYIHFTFHVHIPTGTSAFPQFLYRRFVLLAFTFSVFPLPKRRTTCKYLRFSTLSRISRRIPAPITRRPRYSSNVSLSSYCSAYQPRLDGCSSSSLIVISSTNKLDC